MIDEIGNLSDAITKERLDTWIADLKADSSSQLYIISYNNKNFSSKKYKDRESFIEKYLLDKDIRTDRTMFIKEDKGDDEMNNVIKIFIVPQARTLRLRKSNIMKKTAFAIFFILVFCAFAFGQNSNCPTISVIGPSSISDIMDDNKMDFTAEVSGIDINKIGYKWTVSENRSFQGQGKNKIEVDIKGLFDNAITATVEILNLPEGCPGTDSETGVIACRCISVLIDYFGKLPVKEERARLIAAINEAEKNKDDKIYIILHHPSNEDKKLNDRKERIKKILGEHKLSEDRLVIVSGGDEPEELTSIYLVPPGAELPTP